MLHNVKLNKGDQKYTGMIGTGHRQTLLSRLVFKPGLQEEIKVGIQATMQIPIFSAKDVS